MNTTELAKEFFNRLAAGWDQKCPHDPVKIAAIITLAGIGKGARVADIGCGTGVLFQEVLSREPSELLGIDLSDQMIKIASSKFSDSRIRLLAADFYTVTETGFDAAVIYSAYPHFTDKKKFARKVSSILAEGGRITIAHSQSKEAINAVHQGGDAVRLSEELLSAEQEAQNFTDYFKIDILADTPELYIISGIKRN